MIQLKIEDANVIRKALRNYLTTLKSQESELNLDSPADIARHHDNQKEYALVLDALSFL